jgi:hypothetical protein
MNRFNGYMNSHFSGCRLLARAQDAARGRKVTIHQIPGHWDVVGVSDGVDAWMAPTAASPFFKTATGDVSKIMRALEAGEDPGPVPDAPAGKKRVALVEVEPPVMKRGRVALEVEAPTTTKRNVRAKLS